MPTRRPSSRPSPGRGRAPSRPRCARAPSARAASTSRGATRAVRARDRATRTIRETRCACIADPTNTRVCDTPRAAPTRRHIMVHLSRPHTIHDDYAATRGLRRSNAGVVTTFCVLSGVASVMYAYIARRRAGTAATAATANPSARSKTYDGTRSRKHRDTWRSTWDKGTPRQYVKNLQHDPAGKQ